MLDNLIFSKNMTLMGRALDATSLRNSVIADNIANVDTPGFKRSDVVFEEELKKAMQKSINLKGFKSDPKHFDIGVNEPLEIYPKLIQENHTGLRNDGNNVDIDKEMATLAKNTLMYNFLVDEIKGEFQKIKKAINGKG